jgi:hypothetical protein
MSAALRRAGRAVRDFARGFLGLAAPPPRNPDGARAHLCEKARGRTPCC